MADLLERALDGGVTIGYSGGKVVVKVDPDKMAAVSEVDLPAVKVYEVPLKELVSDVGEIIGDLTKDAVKGLKKALGVKKKRKKKA